jgi:homocysteine S-methyltransferase
MTRALNGDGHYTDRWRIETRIIYEFKRPIGDFEACKLLRNEAGRDILRRIHRSYAEVVARAMAKTGRPYALPRMLHPNCTMLDGTPLADAIARIDAENLSNSAALYDGCLYPTHAQTALQALRAARPDLVKRVRGLKANASPLSPEELAKLNRLAATDVRIWVRDELACGSEFDLVMLGGCCGTDERYIDALARAAAD